MNGPVNLDQHISGMTCRAELPVGARSTMPERMASITFRQALIFSAQIVRHGHGTFTLQNDGGGIRFRSLSANDALEVNLWHAESGRQWSASVATDLAQQIIVLCPDLSRIFSLMQMSAQGFHELAPRADDSSRELDVAAARTLVAAVAAATEHEQLHVATKEALDFLLKQLEELRALANGYPQNPISAAVWEDGIALAEVCDSLTDALAAAELPHDEELASRLASGMACQILAHYPEEIFPRVLRNSRCREMIGDLFEAIGGYEAIVSDFKNLNLLYLLEEAGPLERAGHAILASVASAMERLAYLRPDGDPSFEDLRLVVARRLASQT
jgi:hypothetical protein